MTAPLAEELGSGRILSTDQRDFHTYRWKNRRPFRNLLLA
jgi:predicted nucleic acid-binding protein